MQRMSENFIDAFGFNDAAFNDEDDNTENEMNALTKVLSESEGGLNASSEASKRSQGIFETICEQRFTSFPGSFDGDDENNHDMNQEDEEDPWADKTKEINFSTKSISEEKVVEQTHNSSDEDEIEDAAKKPKKMEVDGEDDDEGEFRSMKNTQRGNLSDLT